MALAELEERLARLDAQVAVLKRWRAGGVPDKETRWEQISGAFRDCPGFEDAVRLGRVCRKYQE